MYTKTLVNTEDDLIRLCGALDETDIFAWDSETNGTFDKEKIELVGLSFACEHNNELQSWYVPVGHHEGEQLVITEVLDALQPYLEDDSKEKICHNLKFDESLLALYDINVSGPGNDTYTMAWMLAQDRAPRGLKDLVLRVLGHRMQTYEEVVESAPRKKGVPRDYNFARVPLDAALSYACEDAYWTYRLYDSLKQDLDKASLFKPYAHVERPFVRVLRNVEAQGVYIDKELVDSADKRLPGLAEESETKIYEMAGEVFNIGAPQQLGRVLFDKLKVGKNVPKTKTGNYSTSEKTLSLYKDRHPIVAEVLKYKKIQKTHGTFVSGTKKGLQKDGRIRPSFDGSGTATGRLSCRNPNLQNVLGSEVEEVRIRDFFIPAPGNKLLVADYGQVELRIMAHLAKDQGMIDAFNSGKDFHEETARKMYHIVAAAVVQRHQRVGAKTINFGIGYGRGEKSIAEQIGCSIEEALEYITAWERAFPRVIQYKKHVLNQTRKNGFVTTIAGRRRNLPNINSFNFGLRGKAERQAFNTKIQGSAADIIKMAMISLEPELKPFDAKMELQIHDELVAEVPEENAEEALETMIRVMENPLNGKNPLCLPLTVDAKIVDRWGDAK